MRARNAPILLFAACALLLGTALSNDALARLDGEAMPGRPFGIGHVTVSLSGDDAVALDNNSIMLTEADGRALYPAFTKGTVRRLIGEVLGVGNSGATSSITAYFLFTGDAPLHLTLTTTRSQSFILTPRRGTARGFTRQLRTWWREFHAAARGQVDAGDYPPLVETYLTAMLGSRLGFDAPLLSRIRETDPGELQQTLELLFGVEKLRADTMRDTMVRAGAFSEVANRPVPPDVAWRLPSLAEPDPKTEIEQIAMHVPEECLYVRFGTFANYIWLSKLLEEFSSDAGRAITLRGHDTGASQRLQQQLALKQSKVGEIFGGQVIADVALIGRDFYMREGAAFGIMFHAKNSGILGNDVKNQRQAALKENTDDGATMETMKLAGRDVSFLSTPDNRIRSFYAVDGDFHLVTTSRKIAERFFEAGEKRRSLGNSVEFNHARRLMPNKRKDAVFIYLSSAFFRGLVSPQYQVELQRRIHSVTDMELVQLARIAARNERKPNDTIDDLISGGFLPRGFGRRPDGSGPILTDDGVIDSMRGARDSFLPIPDVVLRRVTPTEESRYIARSAYYQANWKQMDPLMVGIKRYALDKKGKERLVIDANVSPIGEQKYGWILSILGPPTKEKIASAPGDIVSAQVSVKGGLLLPSVPPHHLFAGIQDSAPPPTNLKPTGFFQILHLLKTTPGYLGGWPKPGFLDLLPLGLGGGPPDVNGYSKLLLGLWRRQVGGFSVLSFDPGILEAVTPHLRPEEADTEAQIRLRVGDLSQSKLTDWVKTINYQRSMQTTLGNVRLLHTLSQQLGVPRDEALALAEQLLGVKLTCTLGGEYKPVTNDKGITAWQTTKLPGGPARRIPEDYDSPILQWFRGLEAALTKDHGRMTVHAQFDMQRDEPEVGIQLPSFDFNLFGKKKKPAAEDKKKPEELPAAPKKPDKDPREF